MRFCLFILSCLFSLVLQGRAFTHPVPAPDTSCLQEKYVATHLAIVTFSNTPGSRYAIDTLPGYFANTLLVAKAYEQLQPNYNVPYKFLPEGGGDEVQEIYAFHLDLGNYAKALRDNSALILKESKYKELFAELQKTTAFPGHPTKIAIIEVPEGTVLRKSIAGTQEWGTKPRGGGIQYELQTIINKDQFHTLFDNINDFFK